MLVIVRVDALRALAIGVDKPLISYSLPGATSVPHPSVSSPGEMAYVFKIPVSLISS